MKLDVLVPQEFPQDSQVRVVRWFRRHGESIKKNEDLVELEFSKAATLQALKIKIQNLKNPDKLKKIVE